MKRETQATLFDAMDRIKTTDPNVKPDARRRLSGQNRKILELLSEGPVRLRDLVLIASKYTGRISDLRKAGCTIVCQEQPDGNSIYTLIHRPPGL